MIPPAPQPKRAEKKLDPCSDTQCRYASSGKCAFGIRDMGCFMEEGAARTMAKAMGAKS